MGQSARRGVQLGLFGFCRHNFQPYHVENEILCSDKSRICLSCVGNRKIMPSVMVATFEATTSMKCSIDHDYVRARTTISIWANRQTIFSSCSAWFLSVRCVKRLVGLRTWKCAWVCLCGWACAPSVRTRTNAKPAWAFLDEEKQRQANAQLNEYV